MTLKLIQDMDGDSILIAGRYQMYSDGVVYDTKSAGLIPSWIFQFRDFVINHDEGMVTL